MHEFELLRDLLILVAVAIPTVALAERLKIPSIVGLLVVGMVIGPFGFGLIAQPDEVAVLAEMGVVLLLFEIGLEVSLARIIKMGSSMFLGGSLQIALTIGAVTLVGSLAGVSLESAIAFGCFVALSSTAIVLKTYHDRGELDTPFGRAGLGILIFQDLAVVPLMVFVPLLAQAGSGNIAMIALRVGGSLVALIAVVVAGRVVVPWVLERVVRTANRELFTLTIAFFGLGAAFVTASVGLSLALGAFIAGLVISESEYGAQAVSDVLPFRALFSGIFFTSVGMLLDLSFAVEHIARVGLITVGIIVGKAVIVALVVRWALRRSLVVSLMTGLGLAQVGEFSFVLAGVGLTAGVVTEPTYQLFLAATILSMLATPFLIQHASAIAEPLTRLAGRTTLGGEPLDKAHVRSLKDHAIIVGYGMSGHHMARVLKAAHLPYIVLEINGQTVRRARQERELIFFGDGTRREVLLRAGIREACVVVFNISSPADERRGVALARELNAAVKIVVRTRTVDAIPVLEQHGATDVVVEEFEAALEMFQRVLRHYRIPTNTIGVELDAMRSEHYGILRGVPKEALRLDSLKFLGIQHALDLVEIEEGARAVGESPVSLKLRSTTDVTVVAVVREGIAHYTLDESFRFRVGDTAVLVGPSPGLPKGAAYFRNIAHSESA